MNKNELVAAVADSAKISKGDAQAAVDAVFSVITDELKRGGDVRLVGFGNFAVSKRAASTELRWSPALEPDGVHPMAIRHP